MSRRGWHLLAGLLAGLLPLLASAADAPFLWKVQKGEVTHYLQGSVHMLPPAAHPLPKALDRAYENAVEIVFEADPGAITEPAAQRRLMLAAAAGPGGLKAQLPAPVYARLQQRAQAIGMPLLMCEPFKAWFCALSLEIFAYQQAGFKPELGIDPHYYQRALEDEKVIVGLETPEAHLDLFAAMSAPMGHQMLGQSLDSAEGTGPAPEAMFRAWRDHDAEGLAALVQQMQDDAPLLHERLLAARNRAWVDELVRRFDSDTPQLVLVGTAHLVGSDGLLELLAARGVVLRPVGEF